MAEDPLASALAAARQALDRGEYGKVLGLLEPLADQHPAVTAKGAGLRLLITTALMGQGRTDQAAACCRTLLACSDAALRSQARDLLTVLEAPALRRPRDWSLTLPDLSSTPSIEGLGSGFPRLPRSQDPPPPPPPPVGPTRAPLGFAALAGVILLAVLLATLLGGCMEVRSDLHFEGPGRIRLTHHLASPSGRPTPWQTRFAEALENGGFRRLPRLQEQVLQTPVLPAAAAMEALAASYGVAAELSGLDLSPPRLQLEERNWLVGVRQHLLLELDLRSVPVVRGLDLALRLEPLTAAAVDRAVPLPVELVAVKSRRGGSPTHGILWPLQVGQRNVLEVRCWRWSALGLGGGVILAVLALVLALQRIRQRLGFGLPQLPA
jgi:hypothetical protein